MLCRHFGSLFAVVLVMPRMFNSWSRGEYAVKENEGAAFARLSAENNLLSASCWPVIAG